MVDLTLKECNIPAHLDIEDYIEKKKNGQMTFTIRLNNGSIVDFNRTDYIDAKTKYFGTKPYAEFRISVKRTVEKQPPVSRDS